MNMNTNRASMLLPGMVLGAAALAFGAWMAMDSRDARKTVRHMTRSAEKALDEMEHAVCRCMR